MCNFGLSYCRYVALVWGLLSILLESTIELNNRIRECVRESAHIFSPARSLFLFRALSLSLSPSLSWFLAAFLSLRHSTLLGVSLDGGNFLLVPTAVATCIVGCQNSLWILLYCSMHEFWHLTFLFMLILLFLIWWQFFLLSPQLFTHFCNLLHHSSIWNHPELSSLQLRCIVRGQLLLAVDCYCCHVDGVVSARSCFRTFDVCIT